ncbi:MAG: antibiotic biosynthesis monooxygenase family protein [Bacillus sp. (in: firmicutes)]
MKIFITSGTYTYLRNLVLQHSNETVLLLQNLNTSVLLHETENETFLREARIYEVINSQGELSHEGYIVMNNVPVTEEGRPSFEHLFTSHSSAAERQPGFQALRVLKPSGSNTYIILTQWNSEKAFSTWKNTEAFAEEQSKIQPKKGFGNAQKIFTGDSYTTKYQVVDAQKDA